MDNRQINNTGHDGKGGVSIPSRFSRSFTREKAIKVLITCNENGIIYAVENVNVLKKIDNRLNTDSNLLENLNEVLKFGLCASLSDNMWRRARIVEVKPLTVHYIDWGNSAEVSLSNLRKLPQELINIPPLAVRMNMYQQYTSNEYGSTKKVGNVNEKSTSNYFEEDCNTKPSAAIDNNQKNKCNMEYNNGVCAVKDYDTKPSVNRRCIQNNWDAEYSNGASIEECYTKPSTSRRTVEENKRKFKYNNGVHIEEDYDEKPSSSTNGFQWNKQNKKHNNAVRAEEDYGTKLSNTTKRIQNNWNVEYNNGANTEERCYSKPSTNKRSVQENKWNAEYNNGVCADEDYDTKPFASTRSIQNNRNIECNNGTSIEECCYTKLSTSTRSVQNKCNAEYNNVPTEEDYDTKPSAGAISNQKSSSSVGKYPIVNDGMHAELKMLFNEDSDVCIPIRSGELVRITAMTTANDFYVTSVDADTLIKSSTMQNSIALQCLKGKRKQVPLELLRVGEIVAVKFLGDGIYYRAKILDKITNSRNTYSVFLVDLGYVLVVSSTELFLLSEDLHKPPYLIYRVRLKGLPKVPLTGRARKCLEKLQFERKPLQIEYENNERESVELIMKGTKLSDVLKDLNNTEWEQLLALGYLDACEVDGFGVLYEDWPIDEVLMIVVAGVVGNSIYGRTVGLNKVDLFQDTFEKYWSMNTSSYIPKEGEFCLVKKADTIYRAYCLNRTLGKPVCVTLVDLGKVTIAFPQDIRKLPIEFLYNIPLAACPCKILNDFKGDGIIYKTVECKIIEKTDDGAYDIEILRIVD